MSKIFIGIEPQYNEHGFFTKMVRTSHPTERKIKTEYLSNGHRKVKDTCGDVWIVREGQPKGASKAVSCFAIG